jgi:hypothetical protein
MARRAKWIGYRRGEPDGNRPIGCLRCRLVDNIKMDLVETGWSVVDWTGPGFDRDN